MATPKDLRLLSYFVAIVRAGSIRAGAAGMRLSPAVVSEALSELEATLDTTLIKRTTRSMTLTEAGEAVYHHAQESVAAADAALAVAADVAVQPAGPLRITMPAELALRWLPPRLRAFEKAYPKVRTEIDARDETVALASSPYDMALRTTFSLKSKPGAAEALRIPLELVCHPDRLSGAPKDLAGRLDRIGFICQTGLERGGTLEVIPKSRRKGETAHTTTLATPIRFTVNNHLLAYQLALEGFGAALLIATTVEADLDTGRLVRLSEKHGYGAVVVRMVMRDKYPSAPARAFKRFVEEEGSV